MRSKPLGFCGPTEGAVTTKRVNEFENREKKENWKSDRQPKTTLRQKDEDASMPVLRKI